MDILCWIIAAISALIGTMGGLCAIGLPVLVVIGLSLYLYHRYTKSKAARETAQSWPATSGTILTSTFHVRRTGRSRSEIPVVVYQYEVGGKMFQSQTIKAGEKFFRVQVTGQARATVARYPVGASVTVYYDPANPAESALER